MQYVTYYTIRHLPMGFFGLSRLSRVVQYEIYDPSDCNTSFAFWLGIDACQDVDFEY
jgi:hypothetical protein